MINEHYQQIVCRLVQYGWTYDNICEILNISCNDVQETIAFAKEYNGCIDYYYLWVEFISPPSLREHCREFYRYNYEQLKQIDKFCDQESST